MGPGSFRAISDHQCFAKSGSSTPPSAKMAMLAPSLTVFWLQCVNPAKAFRSHTNDQWNAAGREMQQKSQSQNPWHTLHNVTSAMQGLLELRGDLQEHLGMLRTIGWAIYTCVAHSRWNRMFTVTTGKSLQHDTNS